MIEANARDVRLFRLRRSCALLLCAVALALGSGCISATSYVDPALPKIAHSSLKPPVQKRPVQVFFEFQNKETTNPSVSENMRPKVVAILEQSRLFSEVVTAPKTADRKLFITVNNVPLTEDAAAKGFGVGLTFGLVGAMVTDGYSMEALYRAPSRRDVKKTYRHALHTTIGNASGPPGLEGMKPQEAFEKVLEELLLNLLNDLSREGYL